MNHYTPPRAEPLVEPPARPVPALLLLLVYGLAGGLVATPFIGMFLGLGNVCSDVVTGPDPLQELRWIAVAVVVSALSPVMVQAINPRLGQSGGMRLWMALLSTALSAGSTLLFGGIVQSLATGTTSPLDLTNIPAAVVIFGFIGIGLSPAGFLPWLVLEATLAIRARLAR